MVNPGTPSSIPTLPEYPGQSFIAGLPPQEWQACLDLWIYSVEYRLRLPQEAFRSLSISDDSSGYPFLLSYLKSASENAHRDESSQGDLDAKLRKYCHLLLRRLSLEGTLLQELPAAQLFELFALGSTTFRRIAKWPQTLGLSMKNAPKEVAAAYEAGLRSIEQELSSTDLLSPLTFSGMRKATNLVTAAPRAGVVFMTGTDYLETLTQCYDGAMVKPPAEKVAKFVTEHTYICLRSLMKEPVKMSTLLDHLYSLKATADASTKASPNQSTLLSSLVCLTTLLRHLEISLGSTPNARGQKMLASLQAYRQMTIHLHPQNSIPRNINRKGKGKSGHDTEMHMHKASQISQVHDLFPDLPTPYVLRLLDHYSEGVELVISALLEPESLPSNLKAPTKEDEMASEEKFSVVNLEPRSTPPLLPQKKGVFDNDDFDNLRISPAKLHRGRKDKLSQAPTQEEHSRSKAAIMAALAAFDSDDDERDDTYDVADVGGTVDDTLDTDERRRRPQRELHEEVLFSAWKDSKELFARDSKTRISQHRRELKANTGWTDEQIEGWGLMLSRDPARENKLWDKYLSLSSFGGNQKAIGRTKWTTSGSGTATEEEDSDIDPNATGGPNRGTGDTQRIGIAGIRGARNFGTGRGGSTAGPADAASTQAARRRKEQGRGRGGASHNRREGRAKKIGRGMTGAAIG
jgi:activating signal cointegrator complex subunit 2